MKDQTELATQWHADCGKWGVVVIPSTPCAKFDDVVRDNPTIKSNTRPHPIDATTVEVDYFHMEEDVDMMGVVDVLSFLVRLSSAVERIEVKIYPNPTTRRVYRQVEVGNNVTWWGKYIAADQ